MQSGAQRAPSSGRLAAQLERLKDLYLLGDITRAAYTAERERVKREVAALDTHAGIGPDARLSRLAELLANVAAGWEVALPEQRHRLARPLFEEVVITDDQVVAVKP